MSDLLTRRPQRGSAYARDTEYTNRHWEKIDEPGGRQLWLRLVLGFTSLAVFGTVILALGSAMFQTAYDFHRDGNTALPMTLCVVGIVCGVLMFFGSLIMGKMVISNKWRKNQKPSYARRNRVRTARVRYTTSTEDSAYPQVEVEIPPPPYDQDFYRGADPSIFCVGEPFGAESNLPPPPDLLLHPPDYSEVSVKPPSYSSVNPLNLVVHSTTLAGHSEPATAIASNGEPNVLTNTDVPSSL